jgi:hypothetical protein
LRAGLDDPAVAATVVAVIARFPGLEVPLAAETGLSRDGMRALAAALGRYPSSATARMTTSRLAELTFGELRSTSDTSDFDTPARAATVSRVGFWPTRPEVAICPRLGNDWSAPTLWAKPGPCQRDASAGGGMG